MQQRSIKELPISTTMFAKKIKNLGIVVVVKEAIATVTITS